MSDERTPGLTGEEKKVLESLKRQGRAVSWAGPDQLQPQGKFREARQLTRRHEEMRQGLDIASNWSSPHPLVDEHARHTKKGAELQPSPT